MTRIRVIVLCRKMKFTTLSKFISACLLLANLKEKSSRTTSEFSVIDQKLSSSIVKLAGRNEISETF